MSFTSVTSFIREMSLGVFCYPIEIKYVQCHLVDLGICDQRNKSIKHCHYCGKVIRNKYYLSLTIKDGIGEGKNVTNVQF